MGSSPPLPTIYIVDGSRAVTGAFVCARNISKALNGAARVVLVLAADSSIGADETNHFARVEKLPLVPLRRSVRSALLYLPALFIASIRLRRMLERDGAQALLINDFYLMHGVSCRLWGFRGKMATWVRIDPAAFGPVLSRIWLSLAARASDHIISVSRHIQNKLLPRFQSQLIYDAIDETPALTNDCDCDRFVFVGNYIPGKGQCDAICAFAAIADDYPSLRLDFYGGDMGLARNRAYKASLQSLIAKLGLANRAFLHGYCADPKILANSIAALNFSRSESLSMTVMEASGAGLPVIATRSGGPSEIIVDGETGILVPVGDIAAMSAAMRFLKDNPKVGAQMGAAGRRRVTAFFSLSSFARNIAHMLDLDLNEHPRSTETVKDWFVKK